MFSETQHLEPIDQEIGVGFHVEKPESEVFSLSPRATTIIPISVISSMWGDYIDTLQLQVNIFILFFIDS